MASNRPMLVEIPLQVNAYDIDAMGIVSNIVYIRWFEDLRMAFLSKYFPYEEMMQEEKSPILAKTEAEYRAPITIFDKPTIVGWMSNLDTLRWEMQFEVSVNSKVHCRGKQNGFFYDLKTKRPTRIPERLTIPYSKEKMEE